MSIDAFVDFLLAYNQKVNLVSRQSTRASLGALIAETMLLKDLVSTPLLIDAGSGGGLLGIPLAISLPEKKFILVETIHKKVVFLNEALRSLGLGQCRRLGGAGSGVHAPPRPRQQHAGRQGLPRR